MTNVRTNEKGGWPSSKRESPPLTKQTTDHASIHQPGDLRGPTALVLYAGADDSFSLKSAMLSLSKSWPMTIWEIDNKRQQNELTDDMLLEEPYGTVCRGALQGHIRVLGGGPNCRTWSILRWFPKPRAPVPVRDRSPSNAWGFPGLSDQDQVDTDNDSLLLLRFLVILTLAHEGAKTLNAPTHLWHTGPLDGSETCYKHLDSASSTLTNADWGSAPQNQPLWQPTWT